MMQELLLNSCILLQHYVSGFTRIPALVLHLPVKIIKANKKTRWLGKTLNSVTIMMKTFYMEDGLVSLYLNACAWSLL